MRYGIRGVPFFVIDGKYGVSGAQAPETFAQALKQVQDEHAGVASSARSRCSVTRPRRPAKATAA